MSIKVQPLTREAFEPYGTFFNVHEGYNDDSVPFLPDRILQFLGAPALDGFCSIRMRYRPIEISVTEYHDDCEEVFGGFNCEVVFHVGLLSAEGKPDLGTFRVFKMSAGTFARVKRKVLHHAGFVLNKDDIADGLVILPPTTYTIDCKVIEFANPIAVEL